MNQDNRTKYFPPPFKLRLTTLLKSVGKMSPLSAYKTISRFRKSFSFKCENLCFLSTEQSVLEKDPPARARRYSKPLSNRNFKFLKENFVRNLFCNSVDKEMFQYPAVIKSGDVDIVLSQTSELESFLSQNLKTKLTDEVVAKLKDLELFGLSASQRYGGAGYTETEAKLLIESAGIVPTIGRFLSYHNVSCKLLELFGTEEQKEKYLPRLAAGESFMTLAYLENGPLIDFSKFEGTATVMQNEKKYMLNAEKKFVHNADRADLFLVMLKPSLYNIETDTIKVKFSMFIVDRKTPGVTIHKLLSKNAEDCYLFDVSFKNVIVPFDNVLQDIDADGFEILKSGLSCNNLSDAALCSCMVKSIIYNVSQFINEKGLSDRSVRGNGLLQNNLASLCSYAFGLESSIYFLAGRFDIYNKNTDFFNESVLVKALAIDILQIAIKQYTGSVGPESFQASGILEEALHTLHYFSVFDENIEYLKMMVAADGLVHSAGSFSNRTKVFRKPYENTVEALKLAFLSGKHAKMAASKHNFKDELPVALTLQADTLGKNCANLQTAIEYLFTQHGTLLMDNENYVTKFAEIAAYIYGTVASLARASNSYCYDFEDYENDLLLSKAFACLADLRVNVLCSEDAQYPILNECYRILGKLALNRKEYPAEHPLSRTY